MKDLNLSRFRENCCYCYVNINTGIQVCKCGLSFCSSHIDIHSNKKDCKVLYSVTNKNGLEIESEILDEKQKDECLKRIDMIVKCKNFDEKVIFKDGEVECPHILDVNMNSKIEINNPTEVHCNECSIKNHLYICIFCGFLGCGRLQYGIEGNGHAMHHYKSTSHCIYVLLQSITPEYDCDTFCYKCDDFIINIICDKKITLTEFCKSGTSLIDMQYRSNGETKLVQKSPFVGIKNIGNTCYISSVMQLLGSLVSIKEMDCNIHFHNCDSINPLKCLLCQASRIFNHMSLNYKNKENEVISIVDFIILVWKRFPMFVKNHQHDANEFLLLFIDAFKEDEFCLRFPEVSKTFQFEIETEIRCDTCKRNNIYTEEQSIFFTCFDPNINTSIEKYFEVNVASCECGGKKHITNKIIRLPEFAIITLGRYSYENEQCSKISESVWINHIDFTKYIKKPNLSEYFINQIKNKGYSEAEIFLSLVNTKNYDNIPEKIEEYKKSGRRTNPVYEIVGSVIHVGNSLDAGHYLWWGRYKDSNYLVNDSVISEGDVECLENSYIVCYR